MKKAFWKILRLLFCLLLILSWITMPRTSLSSDVHTPQEHRITALYLYNFLLFVDWPKNAFSGSNTLKVGVYGAPEVYKAMKPMSGKMIRGKKLVVSLPTDPGDVDDSLKVLFIGRGEKGGVKALLRKAEGKHILTVSHMEGFVHLGGMVTFVHAGSLPKGGQKQKRFIINLPAVHKSGLKIRSRLLRMSHIVHDEKPQQPGKTMKDR